MPDPLYIAHHISPSFQLRWSLALFTKKQLPPLDVWQSRLNEVVRADGVRILEAKFQPPHVWLLLLSTTPSVSPSAIVKSVKGRLQHLVRWMSSEVFRRNFAITSLGDASRGVIENYVADQLAHHRMVDPRVQERLAQFQLVFPGVDLSKPLFSSHGRYLFNLHLVIVNSERWCEIRETALAVTRDMFVKTAEKKGHRLSRLSIQPDHLHATLGCNANDSPEDVALTYMNNLAYAHGMKPMFQFGYYVGTFGEYDIGAVRQNLD